MDIELVRFAGSPLSVTASQPISSAMRSGSNARFTLSYRDVEEMLAEPGLDLDPNWLTALQVSRPFSMNRKHHDFVFCGETCSHSPSPSP